jgi:MFS family permease
MESVGLRRTMLAAIAAVGLGVLITPAMQQAWQLVLLWGVVVGAGTGVTANVLAATVATRWFVARRGLVVGLLTSAAAPDRRPRPWADRRSDLHAFGNNRWRLRCSRLQ